MSSNNVVKDGLEELVINDADVALSVAVAVAGFKSHGDECN